MKKHVYVITPSWIIKNKSDYINGIKNLEKLGLTIINKSQIGKIKKIPSIEEKIKQLHNAFLNRNVDIILAQRGGFGSMKLLPYINFNLIKKNYKLFAGFSDLSILLNVINEKTGTITLHSPMIINFSKPSKFTLNSFVNAINNFQEKNLFKNVPLKILHNGIAKGKLKGGNLITLTALIGTNWEIDIDDTIVFFEDVDEKLHSMDRCFSQWILAGKFRKIKGLILGNFKNLNIKDIYKILNEQIKIKFPVVYCPFIGHTKNKITLPIGATVELNTYKKALIVK